MTESTGALVPATMTGTQKVAALLITLGTSTAARVLARLPQDAVEKIAAELMGTPSVGVQVRDHILEETYGALFNQIGDLSGGQQYALRLFTEAFGEAKGATLLEQANAAVAHPPFDFLMEADPTQVAQLLEGEHPQTIAIVLAHLEPRVSARIVVQLETELQVEVARRIAIMEKTTPEAIALVEEGIRGRITTTSAEATQVGGAKPLAAVLNQVDRGTERQILGTLTDMDPVLADEIRRYMFTFEDIALLDERAMQRLIREIDAKDLALALRTAAEDLKARFFRNMSQRAAEMLKDEMSLSGSVKMKTVLEAQGRIVEIVKRLEDQEEIVINRGGGGGDDALV